MRPELEIRVAQYRYRLTDDGNDIERLVRDAYALGRLDGLREAQQEGVSCDEPPC